MNNVWGYMYDLPEPKYAIEECTLQSGFVSDCSLTLMKGATLPTLPSTGLCGFQFRIPRVTFHDPERLEG